MQAVLLPLVLKVVSSMNTTLSAAQVHQAIQFPDFSSNVLFLVSFLVGAVSCLCLKLLLVEDRKLKGPKRWPLVGSYFHVVRNFPVMHDWLLSYFSDDCRTIGLDWGNMYNINTVDPVNVEYILKTNFPNYPKGKAAYVRVYELVGDGIFGVNGEMWKRHRKIASFEFSSRRVNEFSAQVFKKYAVKLMEVLDMFASSQKVLDFQEICMRMTLDSICEFGFGVQMNFLSPSLERVPFATSFDRVAELLVRRQIGPVWKLLKFLNIGTERELRKHLEELDSFTFKVIQNRRSEIQEYANSGKDYDKQDLLSRFMTATSENRGSDQVYKDKELRDAIVNFVLAGRDTTAVTLSWFVFSICNNPRVAQQIRLELDKIFGPHDNKMSFAEFAELLTTENLRKLHYLHGSISETLRLYPPVPRDTKFAANDDILPDGTKVKKGDTVTYVPYSMGRMEFLWGPDAREFMPERWIKDSEYKPESPYVYTAFQAGPRICLGKDFAYLQLKITLALLMRFFRVDMIEDQVIHYRMLMVMSMLNGIKVQCTRN